MTRYALTLTAALLAAATLPGIGPVAASSAAAQDQAKPAPPPWPEATGASQPEAPKIADRQEWLTHLQNQLNRAKRLPVELHGKLAPGNHKVLLGFSVDATGAISELGVRESSGLPALDEAALDNVRRISPLPAFPADMETKTQQFRLPMVFFIPEPPKDAAAAKPEGGKPAAQ